MNVQSNKQNVEKLVIVFIFSQPWRMILMDRFYLRWGVYVCVKDIKFNDV